MDLSSFYSNPSSARVQREAEAAAGRAPASTSPAAPPAPSQPLGPDRAGLREYYNNSPAWLHDPETLARPVDPVADALYAHPDSRRLQEEATGQPSAATGEPATAAPDG